ncbi:hypothetical protein ABLN87_01130 [Ruegeria sp. SCPT10]|uniref:hypothetical protein n=1 Tax=Ruegeria sp. SCP10 TaxID=3141377 RepID=UPI003339AE0E
MNKLICFNSNRFNPTPGELDEQSDDYINPDVFGKELSEFLVQGLTEAGHEITFSCAEDWGWYHEVQHNEPFALIFGCSNYGDGHMVQLAPKTDYVRKMFKKYHAAPKVEALRETIWTVLQNAEGISGLHYEKE